jgi:EAL domain-containing protein (putative c-di-GMP-specific phosphodiesterase class I)/CheY-like chemotaxis protein
VVAAIRVLVVDDEESVVDVLTTLIGTDPALQLVGAAHDAERGIQLAVEHSPDVVLMDVRMPGGGGIRAVREISRRVPGAGVVALSAHEDEDTRIRMIGAGARDYVPKSESTDAILNAIHRTARTRRARGRPRRARSGPVPDRREEQRSRVERALRTGGVVTTFRPIVDLGTGAVVGVEAQPGVAVMPRRPFDAWIGDAEAVGLTTELELTAIRSALAALASIPADLFVAVELSPATVAAPRLRRVISAARAPRVVLAVSELAYPGADLADALAPLRDRGARLALRDIGTDVEGLARLAALAPEFVRLDRGLTDEIERDGLKHALVAAVIAWAGDHKADVIAGHVSGRAQAEELQALGVRLAQEEVGPPLHLADLVAGALEERRAST